MLLWSGNKRMMIEVLKIKNILYLGLALLLAGCLGDDIAAGESRDDKGFNPVGMPVLFSVGLEGKAQTREGEVSLANNSHFVCTMYYHSKTSDDDASDYDLATSKIHTAWLKVSGDAGNAEYMNSDYSPDGSSFYWQNRLKHAFIAIADNNNLTSTTAQPIYNSSNADFTNVYDLTTGSSIAEQPDPILALATEKPTEATAEGNRVTLNFQHQFSQIQVNVKNAEGTNITSDQITGVELLGVSKTGYVYTKLNDDGTVDPPAASEVNIENYTDDQLSVNKWGTSFGMFEMATTEGYLKSFNAIAFGTLRAIRVTWSGGTATLEVQQTLASGKMYTYNLSIQRPVAASRGLLDDKSQPSELVLDGDVSITNWPVKNR